MFITKVMKTYIESILGIQILVFLAVAIASSSCAADLVSESANVERVRLCDSDFVYTSAHRVCRAFAKELNADAQSPLRQEILEGKNYVSLASPTVSLKGFQFPEWKPASEDSLKKLKAIPAALKLLTKKNIKDTDIEETTVDFDNFGGEERIVRMHYKNSFGGKTNIPDAQCVAIENGTTYDLQHSSDRVYPFVGCNYILFQNVVYNVTPYEGVYIGQEYLEKIYEGKYPLMSRQLCDLSFDSILSPKFCKNNKKK